MQNQLNKAVSRDRVASANPMFRHLKGFMFWAFSLFIPLLASEGASATVLVASVSGEVKALSLDDEFEVTLGKDFLGREISVNSVVTTGKGGTAALLFSNGVVVNLQPNSRLYVRKFVQAEFSIEDIDLTDLEKEPSTSQLEFHLDFGNLVVKAPKLAKGSSMRLTSPLGTAGIRGTIFQLVVVRNPDTGAISGGLNLLSGEIEFSDLSGNVTPLTSGEGMQLASDRLGAQAPGVAGEIADLGSLYVATAPIGRPDIVLPGEAPPVVPEETIEEEPSIPPVPLSIQEIAAMILFALEEAEEAVSNFTLDMLENPLSVAAPVQGVESPTPPSFTASGADLFVDQAPTVSLLGDSVTKIDLSETYTDLGVSVVDFLGNDLSSDVTVTGSVDVNVAGTYPLTYTVTDLRGFKSSVIRTVIVGDFTAPTVSLSGSSLTHEAGTSFTDPGATAFDVLAGQTSDITAGITASYNFDAQTSPPGTYSIIYLATDAAGNEATIARTVTIVDTTDPVITLTNPFLGGEGFDPMFIDLGTAVSYSDPGATALDSFDGDISTSITIDDGAKTALDQGTVGEFSIRYDVLDAAGNSATAYRYITILGNDSSGPTIRLAGKDSNTNSAHDPSPDNDSHDPSVVAQVTQEVGIVWADYGYKAFKKQGNKTFDYTDSVVVSGYVNTATLGTYTLTYTVQDEYLNASSTTRTVTVVDTTAPSITPNVSNGLTNFTIEGGSTYTDPGATAFDTYDGDLTSSIVATGANFSTTSVGAHFITYSVLDSSSNEANASRQITVVDTTAPSITLLDSTTSAAYSGLAIEYADQDLTNSLTYTDPGFTATDLVDGDVSANVQISGSVNLQTVGTYTLTYSVSDVAGNVSNAVSRTVYVLDKDKPLISLNTSTQTVELGSTFVHETATAVDNVDGDLSSSVSVTIVKDPDGTPQQIFSGNQLSVTSGQIDASRTGVSDISNVTVYELTYTVSDNAVDANGNPAPNIANPVVRRVVITDSLLPLIPALNTLVVDEQTLGSPQPVFDLDEAVNDMRTNLVYDPRGDGNSDYFNLDSSTVGNDLAKLTVTLYDLDNTEIAVNMATGDFAKDIKQESGEYTIKYKITDYSGNESSEVTRIIEVRDKTAPTITLYGNNPIHDFFRYDSSSDATANPPTSGTTSTHPVSGDTVGISGFNPSLSPLVGAHDFILAAYNFTDPGVYAEDNKNWKSASQNPPGSYPDMDGDGKGEIHFIEDIGAPPSGSLAKWDRIYRYSEVAVKSSKEWQETLDDPTAFGSVSNARLPNASSNFFDANKTQGNNENMVQLTIFYYVRDEAGNQSQSTRSVFLYESFKFTGYAFYATPLTDNVGGTFEDFSDLNSTRVDMDADGLSDYWEILAGTDPRSPDSDNDGTGDLQEFKNWVDNPSSPNKTPNDPFASL
ncbi:MAG: hypothetical protein CMI31_12755 [Opitutae bacterium]|nr:hypothetical protein [Opitutae bacterium]|tara:strand:- start:5287 stop:9519 length:4233 start_codon:yes stop_codon:yes gene_type:complete